MDIDFDIPKENNQIIKVIGVGGGGGNAVAHMYKQGIHDVSFVICNTDCQALQRSSIPIKIQLGSNTTQGLGAGNKPEKAKEAALESISEIETILADGTKMVFITAGMGGGTGTGAAPVIAKTAKEMGILTVGIVTIPFKFEGKKKINQALDGVDEMGKFVDALLVINNERLLEIYPEVTVVNAFGYADDVLANAAKGISEIVTVTGQINVDFADVNTIMKDGGVAVMNTGYASGENRVLKAIEDALHSPLLNNKDIHEAKRILLNISCSGEHCLKTEEMNDLHEFMQEMGEDIEVIWGLTIDDSLEEKVKITILATGFGIKDLPEFEGVDRREENVVPLGESQPVNWNPEKKNTYSERIKGYYGGQTAASKVQQPAFVTLDDNEDMDMDELDRIPAFKRKQMRSQQAQKEEQAYSDTEISRFTLDDEDGDIRLSDKNDFLHNNVD